MIEISRFRDKGVTISSFVAPSGQINLLSGLAFEKKKQRERANAVAKTFFLFIIKLLKGLIVNGI